MYNVCFHVQTKEVLIYLLISLRNIYTDMPTGMIYLKVRAWEFLYFITRNGNKEDEDRGFKEKILQKNH